MNTSQIKALLDKYYEGETSPGEEKTLNEYFLSGNVSPELEVYKTQFVFFSESHKEELNDPDFESRIFGEKQETPVIPIRSGRKWVYYVSGIAAGFILLAGMLFILRDNLAEKQLTPNSASAELAFRQTQEILAVVSVNFNKGYDKVQYLGKFDQAMKKMQMLSKYYQYQTLIINPDPFNSGSSKSINQ